MCTYLFTRSKIELLARHLRLARAAILFYCVCVHTCACVCACMCSVLFIYLQLRLCNIHLTLFLTAVWGTEQLLYEVQFLHNAVTHCSGTQTYAACTYISHVIIHLPRLLDPHSLLRWEAIGLLPCFHRHLLREEQWSHPNRGGCVQKDQVTFNNVSWTQQHILNINYYCSSENTKTEAQTVNSGANRGPTTKQLSQRYEPR